MQRVKLSRSELWAALQEQVDLMVLSCKAYDEGAELTSKYLSMNLRVLLHHAGRSQSLLQQLGLRERRFLDTAGKLNPRNLGTDCPLTVMQLGGDTKFLPLCVTGGGPLSPHWVPFEKWWNAEVVKDNKGRHFNRRELVTHVANTDGGAHVDPGLDEAYMDLSRKNSLGWEAVSGGVRKPMPSPTPACLRQIAHEVIETLRVRGKEKLNVAYAPINEKGDNVQVHTISVVQS